MTKLTAVISYGLAFVGLGLTISALLPALTGYMNYREARAMILNLLRSNAMRAEPVARNSPGTFYEAIAASIKVGVTTGSRDPAIVATATRPTYDATAGIISQKAKQQIGRGKLGVMAAGGALAIALSKGAAPVIVIILVGLCAIGFGALLWHKSDLERTLVLARLEVLPEVDQSIAQGRIWKQ